MVNYYQVLNSQAHTKQHEIQREYDNIIGPNRRGPRVDRKLVEEAWARLSTLRGREKYERYLSGQVEETPSPPPSTAARPPVDAEDDGLDDLSEGTLSGEEEAPEGATYPFCPPTMRDAGAAGRTQSAMKSQSELERDQRRRMNVGDAATKHFQGVGKRRTNKASNMRSGARSSKKLDVKKQPIEKYGDGMDVDDNPIDKGADRGKAKQQEPPFRQALGHEEHR